jgi:hypothetical protein
MAAVPQLPSFSALPLLEQLMARNALPFLAGHLDPRQEDGLRKRLRIRHN